MGAPDRATCRRVGGALTRALLERIFELDGLAELDVGARRLALRSLLMPHVDEHEVAGLVEELCDRIDGFGPLGPLMRDPAVTDVIVNGPEEIWTERAGRLERSDVAFDDNADLRRFVDRILGDGGARADTASPIADARLGDGSRIHVVLPPVAPDGPLVSIRRFPAAHFSLDDLVELTMLTRADADGLATMVRERTSILISGATGTGKTTLMNALLACVGEDERVVIVEETPELALPGPQFVRLVTRPPNIEGRGEVGLPALVRASLRMRPDRIVVGEVRGPEALTALDALATGHEGSLLTVHAGAARGALERIVALALLGGGGMSEGSLRSAASAAFGAVVHLERASGKRRVADISVPP